MNPALTPSIQAFIRRDYKGCTHVVGPLLEKDGASLIPTHLLITCYMRMGLTKDADEIGFYFISKLSDKWEQRMAALGLGRAKMEEIIAEAQTDLQRLQLHYYLGSYYVSQHMFKQARETLEGFLLSNIKPTLCEELYLLNIEHNYVTTGASGTDIDKPVVELNSQTAKLCGDGKNAEAVQVAEKAHELASSTLGQLHPAYLNSVNNLGMLLYTMGKCIEAKPFFEEYAKQMRLVAGPEDVSYASALEMLALGLIKGRQPGELLEVDRAESSLKEALAIRQKALPENDPEIARTREMIAGIAQARRAVSSPPPLPPEPEKKPAGRWSWSNLFGRKGDETAEQIRASYGFTPEDPILCYDPLGELQFLNSLRCPGGHRVRGSRAGSLSGKCTSPANHKSLFPDSNPAESCMVDRYDAVCDGGEYSCTLYFDMYHPDGPPQPAPRGLSRVEQ